MIEDMLHSFNVFSEQVGDWADLQIARYETWRKHVREDYPSVEGGCVVVAFLLILTSLCGLLFWIGVKP
jgi:hypothetical protein